VLVCELHLNLPSLRNDDEVSRDAKSSWV